MAITPENYFPLGSTIQKTITNLAETSLYRNNGMISVNPVTGHAVIIYIRKSFLGMDGSIWIRHSSDGGTNWSNEASFSKAEQGIENRSIAGGYNSTGRLFVFYVRVNSSTGIYQSINYRYSDNDGTNWSSQFTLSNNSNLIYSPYGHIIDVGNDTLYQTWYGNTVSGTYSLYLYVSTDGGNTFTPVSQPIYSGSNQYIEPTMINVGGGCFITLAKINNGTTFIQFKNENNLDPVYTWSQQGNINLESLTNIPGPPWLSFINYQGVGIAACYYLNKDSYKLKVVFALARDLLLTNGHLNWKTNNTTTDVYTFANSICGYQSFFHPLNQFKGIGNTFEGSGVISYPKIVFTPVDDPAHGMIDILSALMP